MAATGAAAATWDADSELALTLEVRHADSLFLTTFTAAHGNNEMYIDR